MDKLIVPAKTEKLNKVLNFINNQLKTYNFSKKFETQLELATEEIFVNIANYAHEKDSENSEIAIYSFFNEDYSILTVRFVDNGIPFNPLEEKDPDITLSSEMREIGGLGIFLARKNVDEINYQYKKGRNILTFKKLLK
ncbi:serine-protein kinase RsbW [Methanobrevibacter cuticularis]|uniref:Serine-protein kinase RsbW n=1 Tax=Methanobrevibacter cuticularis TaxID=47311 RepID=A0A166CL51_9EURY|nr:ATP-binding protein [Methanobrevibacter cuticularis]KZX14624.1 serine-protein kinase RsbW [Methanobrevibacter cuticularis]